MGSPAPKDGGLVVDYNHRLNGHGAVGEQVAEGVLAHLDVINRVCCPWPGIAGCHPAAGGYLVCP